MSRFDNSKIKAMFGGKGFYIALALCLLAAGTIGYITLFSADSCHPRACGAHQAGDPVGAR